MKPPSPEVVLEELTPDRGFSLHVPTFQVPPGVETQDCYFVAVPDINGGQDLWVVAKA